MTQNGLIRRTQPDAKSQRLPRQDLSYKNNKPAAVVLSELEYQRLTQARAAVPGEITTVQWLLTQPTSGKRGKKQIDTDLKAQRNW